jgi:cell division protein FtsW (lipid II flippase)
LYAIEKGGLVRSVSVFTNSLFWFSLGLIIAAGMYFFDYRKIKSCSWYLFWGILLVWLTVLLFGPEVSSRHMLNLFGIDFVMITPFLLTIALAGIFSKWDWRQEKGSLKVLFLLAPGKRRRKFKCRAGSLLKAFVLLVIPCVFYLESAVISGAVLYAAVFLLLMRASGAKLWRVFLVLLVSMPLIGYTFFALFATPYRFERFTAFMHPYRDPQGAGFLYIRLKEAIHAAGLWGQGFTLPAGMIPEVHTDFILAYVVYTFGWICGLAVLALAITLIIRMNHVAGQAGDPYGRLLVTGLAGIFAVQFFWNILMSLGLSPVFSLSLPFISYGGSQLIIQMAAVGLVLSVYRRKDMVAATEKA